MKKRGLEVYILFGFCLLISILLINICSSAVSTGYSVQYCENNACTLINSQDDAKIKSASEKTGIKASDFNNNHVTIEKNGNIEVELGKDQNLKVKDNSYNLKKGAKLVFDSNGKLTDGTVFSAGKQGGTYRLKGSDLKLPENAKVSFKDKQIIIEMPKDSKLESLKVADEDESKSSIFKIKPLEEGGSFKLPNGDSFNGKTLAYEVDKDGKVSLYFNDKQADIDGLKINNQKENRIDLDIWGKISKDYSGNYISISEKDSRLVIGKNDKGAGIEVKFGPDNNILKNMKDNQNVVLSAGKDADDKSGAGSGTIVLSYNPDKEGKSIPGQIQTYGDFKLDDGAKTFETGINSKGQSSVLVVGKAGASNEKPYAFEMKVYDENGKPLIEGDKLLIGEKNEFGAWPIDLPAPAVENLKDELEKLRAGRKAAAEAKPTTPVQETKPEQVPDVSANIEQPSQQEQTDTGVTKLGNPPRTNPYLEGLANKNIPPKNNRYNSQTIYGDLLAHNQLGRKIYSNADGGQITTMHESDHQINQGYSDGSYDFYLLNTDGVHINSPGLRQSAGLSYQPNEFRGNQMYVEGYFNGVYNSGGSTNSMYDEWMASITSFDGSLQLIDLDKGSGRPGSIWTTARYGQGPAPDLGELSYFTANSLSTATAVRLENPNFFNSDATYRQFVAAELIKAKQIYDTVTNGNYYVNQKNGYFANSAPNIFNTLVTSNSQKVENIRQTVKALIPDTSLRQKYFGF